MVCVNSSANLQKTLGSIYIHQLPNLYPLTAYKFSL